MNCKNIIVEKVVGVTAIVGWGEGVVELYHNKKRLGIKMQKKELEHCKSNSRKEK